MAESVEVLIDPEMCLRGKRMIDAMVASSPLKTVTSRRYTGSCDLLLTYGTGHPVRRPWWFLHRASGRHCIGLDLGYWRHAEGYMRVTIDHDHPQAWIREERASRWDRSRIALRSDADPKGHAVIVGLGPKATKVHGYRPLEWELGAIKMARSMGLEPVYRPKRIKYPSPPGVPVMAGSIEEVLNGAAMVICRHSNVSVDACIAGVPVMCEDGAAYALYDKTTDPTMQQRLQFLQSLAWWNWKPEESTDAWKYILSRLG